MLMLVLITLTFMQGHSGSAKAKNQHCMLSATKQAIRIKLATMVAIFYVTLQTSIWLDHLVFFSPSAVFMPIYPQCQPFRVMMEKYAEQRGSSVKSFRFYFDGELLLHDSLPTDIDLDEDDTIDVIEVK